MSGLYLRAGSVAALVLFFAFLTSVNFIPKEDRLANDFLPDNGLRLGLDLQGGIHWVLGVDIDEAVEHELQYVVDSIESRLEEDGVVFAASEVDDAKLRIDLKSEEDRAAAAKEITDANVLEEFESDGLSTTYKLTSDWTQEIAERTMAQVLEVLRRRIADPIQGIPDSVVTRQGSDRVLVQIPGGQIDRTRAQDLLKSTGFLEFKIVIDQDGTADELADRHPQLSPDEDGVYRGGDQVIVLSKNRETQVIEGAYLVPQSPDITGDYLDDARVGYDPQQRPIVNFVFNPEGGRKFGDLTTANMKKPLAIILDNNVYSAPIIQARITTRGQISGRFSSQEAADLAVVLRAGALSVPVIIEEERTVGPTLGKDSIVAGSWASVIGLSLVIFFVSLYYRLSGLYASTALLANLALLMGIMSLFEATLTLPGIAGLVLTVGMAVDANVIIFERIREEIGVGKTTRAAIATGFNKALWTVLDANITTLITALVLFEFGTGPIKGFAVTLSIGIVTSVFSALVITRLLFHIFPGSRPVQQLSI